MDEKKFGEAIKLGRQALAVRPDDKQSWLSLGVSYGRSGLHEDAIEAYQQAGPGGS